MHQHFKTVRNSQDGQQKTSQKIQQSEDQEDVFISCQAKFVGGKMKVGAVVRILKPLLDDGQAKELRSVPASERESVSYLDRCRKKFWKLHFFEFHDTENLCNLESLLVRFSPKVCFYDLSSHARCLRKNYATRTFAYPTQTSKPSSRTEGVEDDLTNLLGVEQYTSVSQLIKQIGTNMDPSCF